MKVLELGLERDRVEPELQMRGWGTLKTGAPALRMMVVCDEGGGSSFLLSSGDGDWHGEGKEGETVLTSTPCSPYAPLALA